jgi:UDP-N-acetylglucosamine 2-epimerase (non-hydrolysing)
MDELKSTPDLILTEPLRYFDFLKLVSHAKAVITDSGGIQEETTWLGIPCLTMRENTERPVTISVGTNILVGSDRVRLLREVDRIKKGSAKTGKIPRHWDGKAAERIVAILRRELQQR